MAKKISARIKGKMYKTVVRPVLLYGAETWALKKVQERKLDVEVDVRGDEGR